MSNQPWEDKKTAQHVLLRYAPVLKEMRFHEQLFEHGDSTPATSEDDVRGFVFCKEALQKIAAGNSVTPALANDIRAGARAMQNKLEKLSLSVDVAKRAQNPETALGLITMFDNKEQERPPVPLEKISQMTNAMRHLEEQTKALADDFSKAIGILWYLSGDTDRPSFMDREIG